MVLVRWLTFLGVKLRVHEPVAVMDRNKDYCMCPST
jgi:hypothetical protein